MNNKHVDDTAVTRFLLAMKDTIVIFARRRRLRRFGLRFDCYYFRQDEGKILFCLAN
jgi:hypothetical protein